MLTNLVWLLLVIGTPCTLCEEEQVMNDLEFCSYYHNRIPTPQPGLVNCTWYKNNSCCRPEEITALFRNVHPMPGSSPDCQRYTNYMMCFVCAPNQNMFYRQAKVTVCEEFCNAWYDDCSSANLRGVPIGESYPNGREFCLGQGYQIEPVAKKQCFMSPNQTNDTKKQTTEEEDKKTTMSPSQGQSLFCGHEHSVLLIGTLFTSLAIIQCSHFIGISQ